MAITDTMTDFVYIINAFATGQIELPEMEHALNRVTGGDPSATVRDMVARAKAFRAASTATVGTAPAAPPPPTDELATVTKRARDLIRSNQVDAAHLLIAQHFFKIGVQDFNGAAAKFVGDLKEQVRLEGPTPPPGFGVPTAAPFPVPPPALGTILDPSAAARRELIGSEAREDQFRRVLRRNVPNFAQATSALQRALSGPFRELESSFLLDPETSRVKTGNEARGQSFEEFLGRPDRPNFDPRAIDKRLREVAAAGPVTFGAPTLENKLFEKFGGPGEDASTLAFQTLVQPFLQRVSPEMRGAFARMFERMFSEMRADQPDIPFINQLKSRGSSFFGEV